MSQSIRSRGSNNIVSAGPYTVSGVDHVVVHHPRVGPKKVIPLPPKVKGNNVYLEGDLLIVDFYRLKPDYTWEYVGKPRSLWMRFVDWMTGN